MMSFFALLNGALSFVSGLVNFYRGKRLTDAGENKAKVEQLESSLDAVIEANKARDGAVSSYNERGGLPDDTDPNLRD